MSQDDQRKSQQLIREYVGEMIAAGKYVLELVKTQAGTEVVVRHPEAGAVLTPLRDTLDRQILHLERHLDALGGQTLDGGVKGTVSVLGGKIAALFEKFRSETASRMLRDTYSALGLVTISYTMLHSSALALGEQGTADLALEHLNQLTPFVVDLSKVVPVVVVNELADTLKSADRTVGSLAATRTHEAWARVTGGAHTTTTT